MDVQVLLDQRQVTKYHLSKVRLREFVWVGGYVTVTVGWSQVRASWYHGARGPSMSWDLWPRPVVRAVARERRSVHRLEKTAPRDRFGALVYTVATRRSRERTWGRRSVHRSTKTAPRDRFGTLVYTVATRRSRERTWGQECTQIDENGPSGPFWDMCVIPTSESMLSTFRKTPLDVG